MFTLGYSCNERKILKLVALAVLPTIVLLSGCGAALKPAIPQTAGLPPLDSVLLATRDSTAGKAGATRDQNRVGGRSPSRDAARNQSGESSISVIARQDSIRRAQLVVDSIVAFEPPPLIVREFRGAWVASVSNIDWPSSRTLSTSAQQRELLELLDRAVALHLNAILLQVRPAADALYASKIEPWSEYLTGKQGRAPDPYWDPLEFAVKEAHARGLELHAWFNPYRARNTDARSPLAATHIARTNPALIKPYAGYLWMDPGEALVRERTLRVVLDVVRRYDIDGVHIDDYFYPYPENNRRGKEIPFPDDNSWKAYRARGGKLDRADWRRSNVDTLVHALYEGIHKVKPWVKFGISPFGIWQPGYPAGVTGLNAYAKLYADARKWLREGWLDYFTPQLYWSTTQKGRAYPDLLAWWAGENVKARHLWAGNFTSRAGAAGASSFSVSELLAQIQASRAHGSANGNVHFSMVSFMKNQARMNDTLVAGPYRLPALVPSTPWLDVSPPAKPAPSMVEGDGRLVVELSAASRSRPWQWVIQYKGESGWEEQLVAGSALRWLPPAAASESTIWITALNRAGSESVKVPVNADRAIARERSARGDQLVR